MLMKLRNIAQILISLLCAALCVPQAFSASASLPPNTALQVRIDERISSDTAKVGDVFHGKLVQPVVVNGKTLFDKGTEVSGQVLQQHSSGRLSSPGQLTLALTSISGGWFRSYDLSVTPVVITGGSHTKSNIAKIGGGAAAGAVVGGVAAGGKGAALGAGVGAGAGTVVAAATGKKEAVVESEAVLIWLTPGAPTLRPSSNRAGSAYRDDHDSRRYDNDDRHYAKHGNGHKRDHDEDEDEGDDRGGDRDRYAVFSDSDRDILRGCLSGDDYSNLPPGLAKRDRLPPGLEKQLQRNGTLPPGLQKRVQPLPHSCEVRLPRLPRDWERVILGGRVILLDETQRIHDMIDIYIRD
jgi:hypothetical protein